jgi:transcriptional regulator with XRE-family HTH domain
VTCFHFDIGGRARHAGRFIGRVRGELLRALAEKKAKAGLSQQVFPQQALAEKLGVERSLINRQLSGEANLSLRSLADLAWAMDLEISFELKEPVARAGQNQPVLNQPMTTSTVQYGQIKYINGGGKKVTVFAMPANPEPVQAKKSA